ncbi:MAG: HD domain-containing protein [Alphaproteobacteria bacterium]|nr:HD domain-containing protein [Alphaproteobacteria bacterium]
MHRFPRLHEALDYAAMVHNGQQRKGTSIPYLAHPLGVCALVLEYGGDEDQAIAGLLHDVIEDGGDQHRAVIRSKFGDRVADIVEACTDGVPDQNGDKAPWRLRKEDHIRHLREAPLDAVLVAACDKLHNARAIAGDVRMGGRLVFNRFKASREDALWYYQAIFDVLQDRLGQGSPLIFELRNAIEDMRR